VRGRPGVLRDGDLEPVQRIGEVDLARQARRRFPVIGQLLQELHLIALRLRQAIGPSRIHVDMARGAGTKAPADRRDTVVELTQDFHDLEAWFRLDLMLFAVTVHHDHPRH